VEGLDGLAVGPKVVDMLTRLKGNRIGGPVSDAPELSPVISYAHFFLSLIPLDVIPR
jgi:hypothetical protein